MMGPSGFIAVLAGWYTTEIGRQPYTVYGFLRTTESVAPIDASAVGTSLLLFIIVYMLVFGAGTVYMVRLAAKLPELDEPDVPRGRPERAAGITPAPAMGDNAEGGNGNGS
jgi:cytochrome d ubiquinol oxidase subunit I